MVQSRPIPGSEPWLTGCSIIAATLLPLFDSSQLLGQDASDIRMSSRILVIRSRIATAETTVPLGLIVEHVWGPSDLISTKEPPIRWPRSSAIDFLGPVALTTSGTVQLTIPARLPVVHN